jgi:hypothetical protein
VAHAHAAAHLISTWQIKRSEIGNMQEQIMVKSGGQQQFGFNAN